MSSRMRGFTLVELLVVIAIIGILIGLLLPAVQAAREAARRTQCANNLKQIGLAVHGYHDSYKKLPPGSDWGGAMTNWKGSVLIKILPYIEQDALYENFDFINNLPTDNQTFPGTTTLLGTRLIASYQCPSDDHQKFNTSGRAYHNYAASSGPTADITNPACSCSVTFNSYATHPYSTRFNYAGVFHRLSDPCAFHDIIDGLSNTIFFGEVRPACSAHANNGWSTSNNGQGLTSTLIPINYDSCNANAPNPCNRPCNWSTELGFKSRHPGGVQLVFGDGNVRFIRQTISHTVYQLLGGKKDGKSVEVP